MDEIVEFGLELDQSRVPAILMLTLAMLEWAADQTDQDQKEL